MRKIFYFPEKIEYECIKGIMRGEVPSEFNDEGYFKIAHENPRIYHYCELYLKAFQRLCGTVEGWQYLLDEASYLRGRFDNERLVRDVFHSFVRDADKTNKMPYSKYSGLFDPLYEYADLGTPRRDREDLNVNAREWAKNIQILEEGTTADFTIPWVSFWVEIFDRYLSEYSNWKHATGINKLTRGSAEKILEDSWGYLAHIWSTCIRTCPHQEQRQLLAEMIYSYFPHPKTFKYLSRKLDVDIELAPAGSISLVSEDKAGAISPCEDGLKGALSKAG